MLQDLVRKVEETELAEKDPDAEALLKEGLGQDADAIYKLAQTVLIQNMALEQARVQMERMQQQLQPQPVKGGRLLGGLLQSGAGQGSGNPPQFQAVPPSYGAPGYAPTPGYAPPPSYGSSRGGFLRSAATTAAGVAGGMLAFEGIEALMHGGMGGYGFGGGMPVEETVVNNYYGGPAGAALPVQDLQSHYDETQRVTDEQSFGSGQDFTDDQDYPGDLDDDVGDGFGGDDGSEYV